MITRRPGKETAKGRREIVESASCHVVVGYGRQAFYDRCVDTRFDMRLGGSAETGVDAAELAVWRGRAEAEASRARKANLICLGVGLLLNGVVIAAGIGLAEIAVRANPQPRMDAYLAGSLAAGGLCLLMFLIALWTKPDGRAETARQVFDQANNSGNWDQHPEGDLAISVVMVAALYGSYALVEAGKRIWVRGRLAGVDRAETARVLAEICAAPAGVAWRRLLRPGQPAASLAGPLAALLLDGWIELADRGETVVQRSPAMRRALYRHPLAEVFGTTAS